METDKLEDTEISINFVPKPSGMQLYISYENV